MIKKIETIVRGFIRDWKKNPYLWNNEIDVQIEIACRIKKALKHMGKERIEAKYKGYRTMEIFSRVCCEPPIYFKSQGKRKKCFPDIVVFDDIPDPSKPPDEPDKKRNWPMLWVCEIKYETEWGGDFQKCNREFDQTKLKALLQQKDGTQYACILDLKRTQNTKKFTPTPHQSHQNHRLLTYHISPIHP